MNKKDIDLLLRLITTNGYNIFEHINHAQSFDEYSSLASW